MRFLNIITPLNCFSSLWIFLKKKLIHILLSSSRDLSVFLPTPSSVDLVLSYTVISVLFFLFSSVHALPVCDMLPFWVDRKVLCVVTRCAVVSNLNGFTAVTIWFIVIIWNMGVRRISTRGVLAEKYQVAIFVQRKTIQIYQKKSPYKGHLYLTDNF